MCAAPSPVAVQAAPQMRQITSLTATNGAAAVGAPSPYASGTFSARSSASTPLSARQRKQVYMHSEIFAADGPSGASVYLPSRQDATYEKVATKKSSVFSPDLALPSPREMKMAFVSGQGLHQQPQRSVNRQVGGRQSLPVTLSDAALTMPSSASAPNGANGTPTAASAAMHSVGGETLQRASVSTSSLQDAHYPREFWSTSSSLHWTDVRGELCSARSRNSASTSQLMAADRKRRELDSQGFWEGQLRTPRKEEPSSNETLLPRQSSMNQVASALTASERTQRNLASSTDSQLITSGDRELFETSRCTSALAVARSRSGSSDSLLSSRRRRERNFSDLFGKASLPPSYGNKHPDLFQTASCSMLDTSGEIAQRMAQRRWSTAELELTPRSQTETSCAAPWTPRSARIIFRDPNERRITEEERATWESRVIMETNAEVARRVRENLIRRRGGVPPPLEADQERSSRARSASERKRMSLVSGGTRRGTGAPLALWDDGRGGPGPPTNTKPVTRQRSCPSSPGRRPQTWPSKARAKYMDQVLTSEHF